MEETGKAAGTRLEYDLKSGGKCYLLAIAALLAVQFLASIIVGVTVFAGSEDFSTGQAFNISMMYIFQLCTALVIFFYSRKKGMMPRLGIERERFEKKGQAALLIAVPLLTAAVCIACFSLLAEWTQRLFIIMGLDIDALGFEVSGAAGITFFVIVTVVAAPLFEELLFRGVLLQGLKNSLSPFGACLISAAAFALMHLSPIQLIYQFFLGLACAYLTLKSDSLVPAVLTHAFSNALALTLEFTGLGGAYASWVAFLSANPVAAVFITIGLMCAGLTAVYFLGRCFKSQGGLFAKPENENTSFIRSGGSYYIGGLAACVVILVVVTVSLIFF